MRVVLDANILISFLLTHGPTISKIIDYWEENKILLITSHEILTEIRQVFERFLIKKLIEEKAVEAMLDRLEKRSIMISSLSLVTVSPDRKDNRYLACSQDGRADFLVTGDKKDLLALGQFGQTRIVSPKEFVDILEKRPTFTE